MEREPTDDKKAKVTLCDLKVVRDVKGGFGHVIQRHALPEKGQSTPGPSDAEEDEKRPSDN